jgi:hypothetical protein
MANNGAKVEQNIAAAGSPVNKTLRQEHCGQIVTPRQIANQIFTPLQR